MGQQGIQIETHCAYIPCVPFGKKKCGVLIMEEKWLEQKD